MTKFEKELRIVLHRIDDSKNSPSEDLPGQKMNSYDCNYCGRSYNGSCDLEQHMVTHTKEKWFKCDECGIRFASPGSLSTHKFSLHSKMPKKHNCSVCKKKFRTPGQLNVHLKIHSNVKPFACQECPMRFVSSTGLKAHMQRHYSSSKPHACDKCDTRPSNGSQVFRLIFRIIHEPRKHLQCCVMKKLTYELKR